MDPDLRFGTRKKSNLDSGGQGFCSKMSYEQQSPVRQVLLEVISRSKLIHNTRKSSLEPLLSLYASLSAGNTISWMWLIEFELDSSEKALGSRTAKIPLMEGFWWIVPRPGTVSKGSKHLGLMREAFEDVWRALGIHKTDLVPHAEHPRKWTEMLAGK